MYDEETHRRQMYKHWSEALHEAEVAIEVYGTSLARRLTVARLKALVERNAPEGKDKKA
ncbi:MAG: hypothetical protein WB707_00475 [Candidatus Acidiferrales bacterium]